MGAIWLNASVKDAAAKTFNVAGLHDSIAVGIGVSLSAVVGSTGIWVEIGAAHPARIMDNVVINVEMKKNRLLAFIGDILSE
jgi:hypothetical protein